MSFNREVVLWKSPDGTWNMGAEDFYPLDPGSSDYDEEWDVEYTDRLYIASTGHKTEEDAFQSYPGPNPGGYRIYDDPTDKRQREVIAQLEDEAGKVWQAVNLGGNYALGLNQKPQYSGPKKPRTVKYVAADYFNAKLKDFKNRYQGYGNEPHPLMKTWEDSLETWKKSGQANETGKAHYREMRDKYREGLEAYVAENEEKTRRIGYNTMYADERERQRRQGEVLKELKAEIESLKKPIRFASKKDPSPESNSTGSNNSSSGTLTKSSDTGTSGQYHINPETGRANKCYAKKKVCPFGGKDSHYATKAEARAGYEKQRRKDTVPPRQKRS